MEAPSHQARLDMCRIAEGIITINFLEMAAILMQQIALEHLMELWHLHSKVLSDNMSATVWATKKLMVHADHSVAAASQTGQSRGYAGLHYGIEDAVRQTLARPIMHPPRRQHHPVVSAL
jgi:hypothetical protein